MDSATARTLNIRRFVAEAGGPTEFANKYGAGRWTQAQVSQWISREKPKSIGNALARTLESVLNLNHGTMDTFNFALIQERKGNRGATDLQNVVAEPISRRKLPVLTDIQAGNPREFVDDFAAGAADDYVEIDSQLAKTLGPYAFALRVMGASMQPEFYEGDMVIVDPNRAVSAGDYVVAKVSNSNGATLKKYQDRGSDENGVEQFDLTPLNSDFSVTRINAKNPGSIIGVVVEKRKRY